VDIKVTQATPGTNPNVTPTTTIVGEPEASTPAVEPDSQGESKSKKKKDEKDKELDTSEPAD
jgi:hypothetical protein